ncbi:MAG: metallophosphoesterase [Planctomycetes bacterium]|nr:metallophosphoesterase [Planctomycetota bacterium]
MRSARLYQLLLAVFWAAAFSRGPLAPAAPPVEIAPDLRGVRRVVAIGDIHGDYRNFVRLLEAARLVSRELAWTGGDTVLVQTGDVFDRGPDSRQAIELLMRLEEEAKMASGRVVALLGNHEVFQLVGDFRYLHEGEWRSYASEENLGERQAALKEIEAFLAKPKPLLRTRFYDRLAQWLRIEGLERSFPPGYFRHRRLFSPQGRYGRWLLDHEPVVKIDGTVFLHGGLSPRFGRIPFRELRRRFKEELQEYFSLADRLIRLGVFHPYLGNEHLIRLVQWEMAARAHADLKPVFQRLAGLDEGVVFAADGPVWYRGLAELSEAELGGEVEAILKAQGASRIVIGHSQPQDLRIEKRCQERVVLIDVGMNQEVYQGHPEALEILDGEDLQVISPR